MENEDENQESGLAKSHIKLNRGLLVRQFAGDVDPTFGIAPISIFMAGSPGAGKTEFSRRLIEGFQSKPIVIDADDIRKIIPGYLGGNSHVYQAAATKGVHILYDYALEKN